MYRRERCRGMSNIFQYSKKALSTSREQYALFMGKKSQIPYIRKNERYDTKWIFVG